MCWFWRAANVPPPRTRIPPATMVLLLLLMMMMLSLATLPVFGFNFTQCSEKCRSGAGFLYDGCCYVPILSLYLTWDQARESCKFIGGPLSDLAAPLSPVGIYYELQKYDLPESHLMWIGASEVSGGKLRWVTGVQVTCAHVFVGSSSMDERYCGAVKQNDEQPGFSRYGFRINDCNATLNFLCEMTP